MPRCGIIWSYGVRIYVGTGTMQLTFIIGSYYHIIHYHTISYPWGPITHPYLLQRNHWGMDGSLPRWPRPQRRSRSLHRHRCHEAHPRAPRPNSTFDPWEFAPPVFHQPITKTKDGKRWEKMGKRCKRKYHL